MVLSSEVRDAVSAHLAAMGVEQGRLLTSLEFLYGIVRCLGPSRVQASLSGGDMTKLFNDYLDRIDDVHLCEHLGISQEELDRFHDDLRSAGWVFRGDRRKV